MKVFTVVVTAYCTVAIEAPDDANPGRLLEIANDEINVGDFEVEEYELERSVAETEQDKAAAKRNAHLKIDFGAHCDYVTLHES